MLRCTDKYEVRKYIEEKGMGEYLIPLIGIFDEVKDIDFNALSSRRCFSKVGYDADTKARDLESFYVECNKRKY